MIVRKIMYASGSGGIKTIYLEFPQIVKDRISKSIIDNNISSIKKIISKSNGRIYSKNLICKLKIKGDNL